MALGLESNLLNELKPMQRVTDRPIAVDLFAGAGGLSEGFREAGFFVALAVEKDAQAAATYSYNHCRWKSKYRSQVLNQDVSCIDFVAIADHFRKHVGRTPDVVFGGPPCQGFSRANMMTRNMMNPANSLAEHFVRAVRSLQPRLAVLENVADVESFDEGRFVEDLRVAFQAIGYSMDHEILNAVDFGVPQRRRRIFLVASCDKLKVELPKPSVAKPNPVTVWDAISDLPRLQNGNDIDALPYGLDEGSTPYQVSLRSKTDGTVRNNLVSLNSDLVVQRYTYIPQGGNWEDIPDRLMSNYQDKSRCHSWIYRRLREDEASVAITHYRKSMLVHPRENRGLSVREAARLQSFPDHFVFLGSLGSQQQQVANAVPPLLGRAVANRVRRSLDL